MKYKIPYTKTVSGFIAIEAKDSAEAQDLVTGGEGTDIETWDDIDVMWSETTEMTDAEIEDMEETE